MLGVETDKVCCSRALICRCLGRQYVGVANTAGRTPSLVLLTILTQGFKYLGSRRKQTEGGKQEEWFIWVVGASPFGNLVPFWVSASLMK